MIKDLRNGKAALLFLSPLGLTLGPAGQHFVLYVILILWGGLLWRPWQWPKEQKSPLITVAFCFLAIVSIFYLTVMWGAWERGGLSTLPKGWTKSRMGSGALVSGLAFLILLLPKWSPSPIRHGGATQPPQHHPLLFVCQGALVWSALIFIYMAIQHVTGYDPRFPGSLLPSHFQLSTGFYRVMGFTGNPLSVSGQSLAWLTCYGTLGLLSEKGPLRRSAWGVASLHFLCVFMAGGRTALAVALLFFGLCGAYILIQKVKKGQEFIKALFLCGIGLSALSLFLFVGGYGQRALDFFNKQPERLQFWRVYTALFWEKPWLGHGYAWLDDGVRTAKYDAMGLKFFHEKYNAHNVFLETLGCVGFLGTLGVLLAYGALVGGVRRYTCPNPMATAFGLGLVVALVANSLHGFTQNTFFDTSVSAFYIHSLWALVWATAPSTRPV